jgi:hypothetical protein
LDILKETKLLDLSLIQINNYLTYHRILIQYFMIKFNKSFMKDKCIEVEIENEDHKIEITVFKNEMVIDIKKTLMNLYEYKNINMFNTYLGKFHLNEYFDNISIEELSKNFIIEKFYIKSRKSIFLNLNRYPIVRSIYH